VNLRPHLALALTALMLAPPSAAEESPRDARGFSAQSAFQQGEVDSVNLFNGNLTLTLPIGGAYPAGGDLSYGLTLVYNSLVWDIKQGEFNDNQGQNYSTTYPVPNQLSNAGLGWQLSLGSLHPPGSVDIPVDEWRLTVAKTGGRGTVRSLDFLISCDPDCPVEPGDPEAYHDYPRAEPPQEVILEAFPEDPDFYSFEGWSGDCAEIPGDPERRASVVLDDHKVCVAEFVAAVPPSAHPLYVTVGPDAWGRVVTNLGSISCDYGESGPPDCQEAFSGGPPPTVVTVTAQPWITAEGEHRLFSWGRDCDLTNGVPLWVDVTMDQPRHCTALFMRCSDEGDDPGPTYCTDVDAELCFGPNGPTCAAEVGLEVEIVGTGSGAVSSDEPGIDCEHDGVGVEQCAADFLWKAQVVLTAEPDPDAVFDGWSGIFGPNGGSPCHPNAGDPRSTTLVMWRERGCRAEMNAIPPNFKVLTISKAGDGTGTVTAPPGASNGIACGNNCEEAYPPGALVPLTAVPGLGSVFGNWAGPEDCLDGQVEMEADLECTAVFLAVTPGETSVTVAVPSGNGRIVSDPEGILCHGATGQEPGCTSSFTTGLAVALEAQSDHEEEYPFLGWLDACEEYGANPQAQVIADTPRFCRANFLDCSGPQTPPLCDANRWTVTVHKRFGDAAITTSSPEMSCPAGEPSCWHTFRVPPDPSQLTLTVDPQAPFSSWGGDCSGFGSQNPVTLTLNRHWSCDAVFQGPEHRLTLQKTGGGRVTSNPPGIDCGPSCSMQQQDLPEGWVTLFAEEVGNVAFAGWGGACDNAGRVHLTAAKTCTAAFVPLRTLSVTAPSGSTNLVRSAPGDIACPGQCSDQFAHGSTVALEPETIADSDYHFLGWNGDCVDNPATYPRVDVAMTASRTCGTMFAHCPSSPEQACALKKMTVVVSGDGSVSSNTGGITNCGSECSEMLVRGTWVRLTAQPASGWQFVGWTGSPGCSGSNPLWVKMFPSGKTCEALFLENVPPPRTLRLGKTGSGGGTIGGSVSQTGQAFPDCQTTPCDHPVPVGFQVNLQASPDGSSVFAGWKENCANLPGSGNPSFSFDMPAGGSAYKCYAKFQPAPTHSLTVSFVPDLPGAGLASLDPEGTPPGGCLPGENPCVRAYLPGTGVTLVAEEVFSTGPNNDIYEFFGWFGHSDCNSSNETTTVTMNGSRSCEARYRQVIPCPPNCEGPPVPVGEGGLTPGDKRINDTNRWLYVSPDGGRHLFFDDVHQSRPDNDPDVFYTRDGTYQRLVFDGPRATVESGGGPMREFVEAAPGAWRLERIEDRHGNFLEIDYLGGEWRLSDSTGRTHRITFADDPQDDLGPYVESVELAAFGGATAHYDFFYDLGVSLPRCYRNTDPTVDGTITAPLLTSVRLPDGSFYRMDSYAADCAGGRVAGAIGGLDLPTGGRIEWDYGSYLMPRFRENTPMSGLLFTIASGVIERRAIDLDGSVGTWHYFNEMEPGPPYINDPPNVRLPEETRTYVVAPTGDCTTHYFNAQEVGAREWAFGLPFSSLEPAAGGRFLSTQVWETSELVTGQLFREGRVCAGGGPLRSTYLAYDHDPHALEEGQNSNRRIAASRTVFNDDANRWIDAAHSDDNGLGRYRTTVASSNFNFPNTPARTRFTGYTAQDAIPTGAPWLLDVYEEERTTQDGDTAIAKARFDPLTGRLECRRTLVGSANGPEDVVVRWIDDDVDGDVDREEWLGGDDRTPGGGVCGSTDAEYTIAHSHRYGALESSGYEDSGFLTFDGDIDASTGLVETVRDPNGLLSTRYEYDEMGRLTGVEPDEGARVEYEYTPAGGAAPARVAVTWRGDGGGPVLKEEEYRYDGFGRLVRERRKMPGLGWVERTTTYNSRGWTLSVSGWDNPAATVFADHDAFGRPGRITAPDGPDGSVTLLTYHGTSRSQRDSQVATSPNGTQSAKYVEWFDGHGRLVKVKEPGGNLFAHYDYDVGDRLTRVELVGGGHTQRRDFVYDHRGFLESETHPEKDGPVSFPRYDSRGNALRRIEDGITLDFTFDAAERLTRIENGQGQLLQQLEYGKSGRGKSRLLRALRNNYVQGLPGSFELTSPVGVEESYQYDGVGASVSRRSTNVDGIAAYQFQVDYAYDDLGKPTSVSYPGSPGRTVASTYDQGLLTGVVGWTGTISYHANGLWQSIPRVNGVTDRQTVYGDGMPRPRKIDSQGALPDAGGHGDWSSSDYQYDGSGNIRRIGSEVFKYDLMSRLKYGDAADRTQQYAFDPFGNITQITTDGSGRSIGVDPLTNRLDDPGYVYDGRGNLTATPDLGAIQYDAFDMPVRIGADRWHAYTADGERVWSGRVASGVGRAEGEQDEQTFSIRGLDGALLRVFKTSVPGALTWEKDYIHRGAQRLAVDDAVEGVTHFHLDHLGSPRLLTDGSGMRRAFHQYFPFGEEATPRGQDEEAMKFTGHERDLGGDAASDLDYMHARYYSPWVGRFAQIDPVNSEAPERPQSWNRYSYAIGNPLAYLDPDGRTVIGYTGLFNSEGGITGAVRALEPFEQFLGPVRHFKYQQYFAGTSFAAQHAGEGPTVLFGHSLGARAALDTAGMLNLLSIGVDLLITADPAPNTFNFRVPSNVKRAINFFQPGADLGGGKLRAADPSKTKVTNVALLGKGHSDIDEAVAGAIIAEVLGLALDRGAELKLGKGLQFIQGELIFVSE
jgi:RHS repeat-associated protein